MMRNTSQHKAKGLQHQIYPQFQMKEQTQAVVADYSSSNQMNYVDLAYLSLKQTV
jgi:hypothetical protein